jgi:adenosylcobinamide-phosphate synthase
VVSAARRCFAAAAGLGLDRLLGEPPERVHPVALFGLAMQRVEGVLYRDSRPAGVAYSAVGAAAGGFVGAGIGSTAAAVAMSASGRMLRNRARDVQRALDIGDLDGARRELPTLCGRDPSVLDASGIAAATIESVAENTIDAVVAPALWGVALGASGAVMHRAINTMDAMVGYRSDRYRRFGWCSARVDDVAAFIPARVTAMLVCAVAPRRANVVWAAVGRDAPAHPSPNAGVAEAAFAAALGLELGGLVRYGTRVEPRPRLGLGPRPCAADIERAARLAERVEGALITALVAFGALFMVAERRGDA